MPLDSLVTYPSWSTLSVPMKIEITSPAKAKISGTLLMKRGQWASYSVRMWGIEVAVLSVDPDSVYAVDKFHKTYACQGTKRLLGGFPASVDNLQKLLIGQLFTLGNPSGQVHLEQYDSTMWVIPDNPPQGVDYGYEMFADTETIPAALAVSVMGFNPVSAVYDNIYDTPCGPVAATTDFAAILGRLQLNASLTLNFEKAKYNRNISSPPLPNFRGYKRKTMKEFLKSIGIKL